uniref:Uncharacterized protein n=1 Tax=Caenorhabditis tropicalis TaxID=1561998 RepID=A0A1I7TRJ7_9PELO
MSAIGLPLPPTEEGGEILMPPKTAIRRCSTITSFAVLARKLSFASQLSDPAQPVHPSWTVSTSSIFELQFI